MVLPCERGGLDRRGMEIQIVQRSHSRWSIVRLHHYIHRDKTDVAVMQHLMATEVMGDECKEVFKER